MHIKYASIFICLIKFQDLIPKKIPDLNLTIISISAYPYYIIILNIFNLNIFTIKYISNSFEINSKYFFTRKNINLKKF